MRLSSVPPIILLCVVMTGLSGGMKAAQGQSSKSTAPRVEPIWGPTSLRKAGWVLPAPYYPPEALKVGDRGVLYVKLTTGANGRITQAEILDTATSSRSLPLRKIVLAWAWYHWAGPPNSTAAVSLEFRYHGNARPPEPPPTTWVTPHPPYPIEAARAREQGAVNLQLVASASGRVRATVVRPPGKAGLPILEKWTVPWVEKYWKGPPNATKTMELTYVHS